MKQLAPCGKAFPHGSGRADLPLCDFAVFSPAFSMTRQGQTGREAGAQSHGPPWGSRATEGRRTESHVTEGHSSEPCSLGSEDVVARRLASPSTRPAPPSPAGRGSDLPAGGQGSPANATPHHVPKRAPRDAHDAPRCRHGRARMRLLPRPGCPAFAPARVGGPRRSRRDAPTPASLGRIARPEGRGASRARRSLQESPPGLWGRARAAMEGGVRQDTDPWGQILVLLRLEPELARARSRGGRLDGLSGNRVRLLPACGGAPGPARARGRASCPRPFSRGLARPAGAPLRGRR